MQCQSGHWSDCRAELREAWSTIESRSALARSPFAAWDYFDSVAQVRDDVEVVVCRQAGEIVGCFPFQRRKGGCAIPVGGILNDFHGPLAEMMDTEELSHVLRVASLDRFDFHASPIAPWNSMGNSLGNSQAAMSHGVPAYRIQFDAAPGDYVENLMAASYSVRQQKRKAHAAERRYGPLRFVWRSQDNALLETLLAWKSQQYRSTGVFDIFSLPWTGQLLRQLLQRNCDTTHGLLSALYAGDELVAVHFGLCSKSTLHSWFPAYSVKHAQMSPGMELFLRIAAHAPAAGLSSIDMGIGVETFKGKLANSSYTVASGSFDLVPWRGKLRALSRAARHQAARLPWSKPAKRIIRQALRTLSID